MKILLSQVELIQKTKRKRKRPDLRLAVPGLSGEL
jgi:hypothetical protein